jgi:hypothetical protein
MRGESRTSRNFSFFFTLRQGAWSGKSTVLHARICASRRHEKSKNRCSLAGNGFRPNRCSWPSFMLILDFSLATLSLHGNAFLFGAGGTRSVRRDTRAVLRTVARSRTSGVCFASRGRSYRHIVRKAVKPPCSFLLLRSVNRPDDASPRIGLRAHGQELTSTKTGSRTVPAPGQEGPGRRQGCEGPRGWACGFGYPSGTVRSRSSVFTGAVEHPR